MQRSKLPLTALTPWMKLNNADFIDIKVEGVDEKGLGLVANKHLTAINTHELPTLLAIPNELILSAGTLENHAKADRHLRELLEVAGGKSLRIDLLLFLLMQMTMSSTMSSQQCPSGIGVSSAWTEYVQLLPDIVPLPTTWTEDQQDLLIGTSLESAVFAKNAMLVKEFEALRDNTVGIGWCQKTWWQSETLHLDAWIQLDAWYRSRSLELPKAGIAMVPCLDMANHAAQANAFYEQNNNEDIVLLLRNGQTVHKASEITISYGSEKSAAEMMFSYGFVPGDMRRTDLVLDISPTTDDPLAQAKLAIFGKPPRVTVSYEVGKVRWDGSFLYLACLNEEDGLGIRVLQERDGNRSTLRLFWQDTDVTDQADKFGQLIQDHPQKAVFELRVLVMLQERLTENSQRLQATKEMVETYTNLDKACLDGVKTLRHLEMSLLEDALEEVETQITSLIESPTVVRYLEAMNESAPLDDPEDDPTDETDFS